MNRVIVCLVLMISFVSCEKNDSFEYSEESGLNFVMRESQYGMEYNFATQKDPNAPVWEPYFYGDSLLNDTVSLIVHLTGELLPVDRQYSLKVVDGTKDTEYVRIEFLEPYELNAGKLRDTARIVIHRPLKRGTFEIPLTFDTEMTGGMFGKGLVEQSKFVFTISDRYSEPQDWDVNYWGTYSEEKYAFFVTTLNRLYSPWDSWMFEDMRNRLNEALIEYNLNHPDNVKDFTFPGYSTN